MITPKGLLKSRGDQKHIQATYPEKSKTTIVIAFDTDVQGYLYPKGYSCGDQQVKVAITK